jgi:hypothetical protein
MLSLLVQKTFWRSLSWTGKSPAAWWQRLDTPLGRPLDGQFGGGSKRFRPNTCLGAFWTGSQRTKRPPPRPRSRRTQNAGLTLSRTLDPTLSWTVVKCYIPGAFCRNWNYHSLLSKVLVASRQGGFRENTGTFGTCLRPAGNPAAGAPRSSPRTDSRVGCAPSLQTGSGWCYSHSRMAPRATPRVSPEKARSRLRILRSIPR